MMLSRYFWRYWGLLLPNSFLSSSAVHAKSAFSTAGSRGASAFFRRLVILTGRLLLGLGQLLGLGLRRGRRRDGSASRTGEDQTDDREGREGGGAAPGK